MPELTELTERQPEESATATTTAQPPSMLRWGRMGESERGGREGVRPRFGASLMAARKQQLMATKGPHFSPIKASPSLLLLSILLGRLPFSPKS